VGVEKSGSRKAVEQKASITWVRQIFFSKFSAPNPCDKRGPTNKSKEVKENKGEMIFRKRKREKERRSREE